MYIFNGGAKTATIARVGGDTPFPGESDGDSKGDLAVWRSAESGWYIYNSDTIFGAAARRIDIWVFQTDITVPSTYFP